MEYISWAHMRPSESTDFIISVLTFISICPNRFCASSTVIAFLLFISMPSLVFVDIFST